MAGSAANVDSSHGGYWRDSMRPLVSLAFVAPMLACYEAGVLLLGPQALRNGADVWLRRLLDAMGFGQYFLLPLLTCGILLAWHHAARHQWKVRWSVCGGMLGESLALGVALLFAAQLQHSMFAALSAPDFAAAEISSAAIAGGRILGYFGAGIYEELLFRLMLLPLAIAALRWCGAGPRASLAAAVLVTSLVFSAAHYELFAAHGDAFEWFSFTFRFTAGVFFSLLFVLRGFGVTVGAHAFYDILVASL